MSNKVNKQVRSANAILIVVRDQVIGISSSCRIQADFALQDQAGIGDTVVIEYVPGIARVTVSLSGVLLITQNLTSAGILPRDSVRDILDGNVFDVGIYSTVAGTNTPGSALLIAHSCMPSQLGYSVQTGQAMQYDHSFAALDLSGNLLN